MSIRGFVRLFAESIDGRRVEVGIALGSTARCTITGFSGVVVASSHHLYGCNRYAVQPTELHEGRVAEVYWFDEPQLEVTHAVAAWYAPKTGGPRPAPTPRPDPVR